ALGEELYAKLQDANVEVMLDDRKERFGFKMKDAELIGFPYTIVVGKELVNGSVQIFERSSKEKRTVNADEIYEKVMELI
ncbi:MAG: His/Gly/Thr/Pro-type tRNA ligase C-terminal domain-containing protein, partial [Campylobacterota bacterium]|nr:His/Gly/Thr/Pro-type tRNA ligase C-terminal domain-containing protein [Campylobacterota bacterium]